MKPQLPEPQNVTLVENRVFAALPPQPQPHRPPRPFLHSPSLRGGPVALLPQPQPHRPPRPSFHSPSLTGGPHGPPSTTSTSQAPTALLPQPRPHRRPPRPSRHSPGLTGGPRGPPSTVLRPSLHNPRLTGLLGPPSTTAGKHLFLLWFCAHLATSILWGPSLQCSCPCPQLLHVSVSVLVRSLSSS